MSVERDTCAYCGGRPDNPYELSAALVARTGKFPLPVLFAAPPVFCDETCAVLDLASRRFDIAQPDADEVAARVRGSGPLWLEGFAAMRTSPLDGSRCCSCGEPLDRSAYELLGFHPFTRSDVPPTLELAQPVRFCDRICAQGELEARGLGLAEPRRRISEPTATGHRATVRLRAR